MTSKKLVELSNTIVENGKKYLVPDAIIINGNGVRTDFYGLLASSKGEC
jgi:hypothetical protein